MSKPRNMSYPQNAVPIPLAAMVIDMRNSTDNLIKTLRLEIGNLALEKQEQRVNHWQFLADFIEFTDLRPLDPEDITALWERIEKDRKDAEARAMANVDENTAQKKQAMQWQAPYLPFNKKPGHEDDQVMPNTSMLPEEYQDCTHRFDIIRNARHNALSDLGKSGRLGKNKKYARTHAIFITDAADPASLKSASVFAAYLKQYYRDNLEHSGYEDVLITSVICMNHPNTADPPRLLINNLRWANKKDDWEHINALIINEAYRADAGWLDAETQSYLAELLLYTLLIVEPLDLYRIPEANLNGSATTPDGEQDHEIRQLHPRTFIFGLSTVEHSTRWGRLYLNTGLADQAMQTLYMQGGDSRAAIEQTAQEWLQSWMSEVNQAVPQYIPGNFPYTYALEAAGKKARPASAVFPEHDSRRNIEERSIDAISAYANEVSKSYSLLEQDQSQAVVNAMNKLPKDEGNKITAALKRAQRVLSEKDFFSGATGCIPRAKLQLEFINDAIVKYSSDLAAHPLNVDQMRREMIQKKEERIRAFRDHCEGFPFLRAHPWVSNIVVALTLLLCAFTGVVIALAAYAFVHHLAFTAFPAVASALDATLFGSSLISLSNIIIVLLALLGGFLAVSLTSRYMLGRRGRRGRGAIPPPSPYSKALVTEFFFAGVLLVFAIFGFIVSGLLMLFANDPTSFAILARLGDLPFIGWLALVVWLICVIGEIIHYFLWFGELLDLRESAINDLKTLHESNINAIKRRLSDIVSLDLLRRAGLTDGQGGRGPYYKRLAKLNSDLGDVETQIKEQLTVVSNRLLEQQVTLHFRKELLDVKELTAQSQKFKNDLVQEPPELQEFAEVLLRVMGEESPADIENMLRDERTSGTTQQLWRPSYLDRRALHHLQVLTAAITSVALRIVIDMPETDVITPLDRRLNDIADVDVYYQITLKTLIERMQSYQTNAVLNKQGGQPLREDDENSRMIVEALTLWSQIFWIHKDSDLDELLKQQDVFVVLKRQKYHPQTIRDLLGVRVNPGGRPQVTEWNGGAYLIAPPSGDSYKYILSMDHRLDKDMIYDSPDTERFIMLFLHHYPALPMMLPVQQAALPNPNQPALNAPNGNGNNPQDNQVASSVASADDDKMA